SVLFHSCADTTSLHSFPTRRSSDLTGATNYTWTPATGLSCTNCPDPVASPTTTTTYTVVGSDDFGCTGEATVMIIIQTVCGDIRSEEHTSELQSRENLVCRLLLEKK